MDNRSAAYIAGHVVLDGIGMTGLVAGVCHCLNLFDGVSIINTCAMICFFFIPVFYFSVRKKADDIEKNIRSGALFLFVSKLLHIGAWLLSSVVVLTIVLYYIVLNY